tara:strand:- start:349 stop:1347 length:999 start_codon:yes stop_codon:yes gene_type:complete
MLKRIILEIKPTRIFFLADTNTKQYCYSLFSKDLPEHNVFTIKPGEKEKNLNTCTFIWQAMTDALLDRHSLVINLGGGVICDMGGFCASVFKRGISFINCPTTLLSQVDASIGGKLGIDFENYKNHIGLFRDPNHVIISNIFLKTLPQEEILSGYAEIIKHALINSPSAWEKQLTMDISGIPPDEYIAQSIQVKYRYVSQDLKESGLRKALNFGHTIGHAVESVLLDKKYISITHGKAIVVGLIAESWMSHKCLGLDKDDLFTICDYLTKFFPKIILDDVSKKNFSKALRQDKKNRGNKIMLSAIKKIGDCVIDYPVSEELCWEALNYYKSL